MTQHERNLIIAVIIAAASIFLLPDFPQDQAYHQFADQRTLWGIPNALNTLSNLGFLYAGLWGLMALALKKLIFASSVEIRLAGLFFAGLVLTALGSGWYHLNCRDATLAWDRMGMVVTFAGVLGLAAAQKISLRAGQWLGIGSFFAGIAAVLWWQTHANLMPYIVIQFGGMALVAWFAFVPSKRPGVSWGLLIICYVVAKLFEAGDAPVFRLSGNWVSGHTLKHVAAAGAAFAFLPAYQGKQHSFDS